MPSHSKHVFSLQNFSVLPKFVGTWRGDWLCLDTQANVTKQFTATLNQAIVDNRWVQTNNNDYADGSTDTWRYFGEPISDNEVALNSPDSPYDEFKMSIREVEKNLILLQVWDKASGVTLAIETIYLVNPKHRVRTMQQFTSHGELRGYMLINEQKIA